MKHLVLALLLLNASGCSFIFTQRPPNQHATLPYFDCSTSKFPPILDTVIAGLQAVRVGLAVSASKEDYAGSPISRDADIGIGIALSALYIGSAGFGYSATSKCRNAKAQLAARTPQPVVVPAILVPAVPVTQQSSTVNVTLPTNGTCAHDQQCKGTRICHEGHCVDAPVPEAETPEAEAPVTEESP